MPEETKQELRKEYRKKTLAMAREVSASGSYKEVEGMICDWWFEKMDELRQTSQEREREIEKVINEVVLDMEQIRDEIDRSSNYNRKLEFIKLYEFQEKLLKALTLTNPNKD